MHAFVRMRACICCCAFTLCNASFVYSDHALRIWGARLRVQPNVAESCRAGTVARAPC